METEVQFLRKEVGTMTDGLKELVAEVRVLNNAILRLEATQQHSALRHSEHGAALADLDVRVNDLERLSDKQDGAFKVVFWLLGVVGSLLVALISFGLSKV